MRLEEIQKQMHVPRCRVREQATAYAPANESPDRIFLHLAQQSEVWMEKVQEQVHVDGG